jgi:hypothetical protein
MNPETIVQDHIFNDDLLINEKKDRGMTDLEWAREQFPEIIHLLDYPRLREKFKVYEDEANYCRDWVRRLGFGAVISATIALLAVATEPVWPQAAWTPWVALIAELGGIAGLLIAAGWIWPLKTRWLKARLMTERIRQWHFQLMVRRATAVETSFQPGGQSDFARQRDVWFNDFLKTYEDKQVGKLNDLTGEKSERETWLHELTGEYSRNSIAFPHLCKAFKRLRFDHQVGYANYKLRSTRTEPLFCFTKWPAVHQMKVLSASAGFCFVCATICSIILIWSYATEVMGKGQNPGISLMTQHYVRAAAIAVALIGAALRTIQEGLAPDEEIERYEDYKSRTIQLRDRFETTDVKKRLHLMEELEHATVDEMKGFLRTHHKATFVLA